MIIPPERVVAACRLGIDEANLALDRAKGGDLAALAHWVAYSVFRSFLRKRAGSPSAFQDAEELTLELFDHLDLRLQRTA